LIIYTLLLTISAIDGCRRITPSLIDVTSCHADAAIIASLMPPFHAAAAITASAIVTSQLFRRYAIRLLLIFALRFAAMLMPLMLLIFSLR